MLALKHNVGGVIYMIQITHKLNFISVISPKRW